MKCSNNAANSAPRQSRQCGINAVTLLIRYTSFLLMSCVICSGVMF